jgi:hypothetical protein
VALGSDGLRGELTLLRAARALAAFEGDVEGDGRHLRRIAPWRCATACAATRWTRPAPRPASPARSTNSSVPSPWPPSDRRRPIRRLGPRDACPLPAGGGPRRPARSLAPRPLRAGTRPLHGLLDALPLPRRKIHPTISDDQLFGGVDLSATLSAGRLVRSRGSWPNPPPFSSRWPNAARGLAVRLGQALDARSHCLVALDEGAEPDETLPPALSERLAFFVTLDDVPLSASDFDHRPDAIAAARAGLAGDARAGSGRGTRRRRRPLRHLEPPRPAPRDAAAEGLCRAVRPRSVSIRATSSALPRWYTRTGPPIRNDFTP